jgi:hypothetical protein
MALSDMHVKKVEQIKCQTLEVRDKVLDGKDALRSMNYLVSWKQI